jgi:hypothetical protein
MGCERPDGLALEGRHVAGRLCRSDQEWAEMRVLQEAVATQIDDPLQLLRRRLPCLLPPPRAATRGICRQDFQLGPEGSCGRSRSQSSALTAPRTSPCLGSLDKLEGLEAPLQIEQVS